MEEMNSFVDSESTTCTALSSLLSSTSRKLEYCKYEAQEALFISKVFEKAYRSSQCSVEDFSVDSSRAPSNDNSIR